ncbi:MAG: ribokinase [Alphaproteobacteria bacterium]|nr:ribokinase [Alphaproteobacteria bacterium]
MIIVFGSINMDIFMPVEHLPVPGETVLSPGYEMSPGGKGANQALAAARSGAKVAMIGRVGDDGMGARVLNNLRRAGVMTSGIVQSEQSTGCAVIARDANGENQILVALGANADVIHDQIPDEILGNRNMVVMQNEILPEQNWMIIERAAALGATTILNLAPAIHIPEHILKKLDYLIVNQIEARQIAAAMNLEAENHESQIAGALSRMGDLTCIVTMGERGSFAITPDGQEIHVPALELEQFVDKTGAGDAYCGTFAAALHAGLPLTEALKRAAVAGSLTCLNKGAQPSFPYLGDIEENLAKLGEVSVKAI